MNDNIPVSNLPSKTTIRWWSGPYGGRQLNERRIDVLIPDLTRLYKGPSADKPYWADSDYTGYPCPWGISGLGF